MRIRNVRTRAGLTLALACGLTLPCARGAAAVEDGGTRSPLASGAGTRALAMGGAFVAIAADVEALAWNPAGLARATRTGFAASHDQRMALDASVEHAALVLPSWRWGVMAIGIHHLGVSGVEPRDDRNVKGEGEISGGETEISLGYARTLGEAWSLGAAVKLQSQSLAGVGASAMAADAGVRVALGPALGLRLPWLHGLSGGVAIRNLLEPAMRLDRESVRDPRVWRAGLGWETWLKGGRELRLALDLDRSEGVAARPHVGAELRLHPLLALRAGLDDGRPTAGAGVRWRDLEVSYGFEDMAFTPIHRIGVSHAFGPTVSARREAARAAGERAIQARLDGDFERRRGEQLASLIQRAEEALARREFGTTVELLGAAATLDSADTRIAALEARGQRELGLALEAEGDVSAAALAFRRTLALAPADSVAVHGEQRCRARLERLAVRDAGRRRAFQAALDALAGGDLPAARTGFAALAASDSSDAEARDMLRRTREAIARQVGDLVRQARRQLETQNREEAERLLTRIRALDPRAAGLDELAAALARAPKALGSAAAAPPRPSAPVDPRGAEEMFRRGVAAMSAGRADEALRFWELSLSLDPSHPGAMRRLNGEYLVRGMDAHAAGRLEEAVGYWEKALRADPRDPRAAGFLARARERQERTREILGGSQ
jgi:tetratricopeptide (TPR) repeat protein